MPGFQLLARAEAEAALLRDKEDQEKLATGVAEAVARGVLEERPQVEPVCRIQTEGKSIGAIAGEIRRKLGDAPESGCVLVLQGRSGTGKSTLAKYLQAVLPRSARWSNGNVFRALTLLALHHCQKSHKELGAQLTHELLQMLMSRLEFGKFREDFDIKVSGLGNDDVLVSEIANTLLKEPEIGRFVPTVAAKTQGEVVNFAANAAQIMQAAGMSVLMEGRSQSLDYIRTPHRFELIMNDANIIGERRAAQRVIGAARAELLRKPEENAHSALELALRRCSNSDGFSLDTPALRSAEPRPVGLLPTALEGRRFRASQILEGGCRTTRGVHAYAQKEGKRHRNQDSRHAQTTSASLGPATDALRCQGKAGQVCVLARDRPLVVFFLGVGALTIVCLDWSRD